MELTATQELLGKLHDSADGVQLLDASGEPVAMVLSIREHQRLIDAGKAIEAEANESSKAHA